MSEALQLALISGFLVIISSIASSWLTAKLTRRSSLEAVERQQAHENRRAMLEERRRYRREQAKPLKEMLKDRQEIKGWDILAQLVVEKVQEEGTNESSRRVLEEITNKYTESTAESIALFISTVLGFPDLEVRRLGSELAGSWQQEDFFDKLRAINDRLESYVSDVGGESEQP